MASHDVDNMLESGLVEIRGTRMEATRRKQTLRAMASFVLKLRRTTQNSG